MRRFLLMGVMVWVMAAAVRAQDLPQDPRWLDGELSNGMRYLVLHHSNPPGRVAMWLHIRTGSLNESDRQRGLAHFLEHMAFNGTEHFPPGEVVKFFERMGMKFGADLNAHTGFDQTVYKLRLPDAQPATLTEGLGFFADVAFRMTLLDEEIEAERGIIMEEKRSSKGAQQRVLDFIFQNIAPGSRFGQRLPIGTDDVILGATRQDFVEYYDAWYAPSRMTLIVAADMDPALAVEKIREVMDVASGRTPRDDQDPLVEPSRERRALVTSDRELTRAEVTIVRIDEPTPPMTTEQAFRAALVEDLASGAFNRRMSARVQRGEASFQYASASVDNVFGIASMLWGQASGEPDRWSAMLAEMAHEIQRARAHGFSEREIDDVRREFLADAERAVEVERTLDAWTILTATSSRISERQALMSAAQRLELTRRLLGTITRDEASAAFSDLADLTRATFIVTMPSGDDVPKPDAVLALATESLAVTPGPLEESDRPEGFLAALPDPGSIVEQARDESGGVTSAWLSNGVRVHYRFMDYEEEKVNIVVTLAGGEILEHAANRGVTQAAGLAWQRPATQDLTSTNVRDLMTGYKVGVGGRVGQDAMSLSVSGHPQELEHGLQLAHALLTRPRVEEAGFVQWKERVRQGIAARDKDLRYALGPALYDAILPPDEPRLRDLTSTQLDAITLDEAQAWLDRTLATAPIEVAVVGDIDEARAMDLVMRYLGSLPPRDRISSGTLDDRRNIPIPDASRDLIREIETETPMAFVVSGFLGVEAVAYQEERALSVAAQALTTRLVKALREDEQLVYSISAGVSPGWVYPSLGTLSSFAPTDPGKSEVLATRLRELYAEFAEAGPTPEETEVAKKQTAKQFEEQVLKPAYWTGLLATLDYRGRSVDDIMDTQETIAALTPEDVRKAFAKHFADRSVFQVIVRPLPTVVPKP